MERILQLTSDSEQRLWKKVDRMFALLMLIQWLGCVLCALLVAPLTWIGTESNVHVHVWAAIILGGFLAIFPAYLALKHPGETATRHSIAISQMLMSALLIHITGGRIETHFHVFGSLAFLMMYRDWRVIVTGSVIISMDHMLRGLYFPRSVFGLNTPETWRWLEHAGWVAFEDIILIYACLISRREMFEIAQRQSALENLNANVEKLVDQRTLELEKSYRALSEQKERSLESARLASLGKFASHLAHEVKNPLTIIYGRAQMLSRIAKRTAQEDERALKYADEIVSVCERIDNIIDGVRRAAQPGTTDDFSPETIENIFDHVSTLTADAIKEAKIAFKVESENKDLQVFCRSVQIAQILVNLISNSKDAIANQAERWIKISATSENGRVHISVTDSGLGIPQGVREKLMTPFFTTKGSKKGTGLGLSISQEIALAHKGSLRYDAESSNTRFILELPLYFESELAA